MPGPKTYTVIIPYREPTYELQRGEAPRVPYRGTYKVDAENAEDAVRKAIELFEKRARDSGVTWIREINRSGIRVELEKSEAVSMEDGDGYYMVGAPGGTPGVYVLAGRRFRPSATPDHDARTIPDGSTLQEAIQEEWRCTVTVERCLPPDHYHPRIYRPLLYEPTYQSPLDTTWNRPPHERAALSAGLSQLSALKEELASICRVVEPCGRNLETYGHDIRSLLILACTEVESHFRGILMANELSALDDRPTMAQYVALLDTLRLPDYRITLALFDQVGPVAPFQTWSPEFPTESLDWYQSYNLVKHNREAHLPQSTLRNAIAAVTACAILLQAQFGDNSAWDEVIGSFFVFTERPHWRPAQFYIPQTFGRTEWVAVPLRKSLVLD